MRIYYRILIVFAVAGIFWGCNPFSSKSKNNNHPSSGFYVITSPSQITRVKLDSNLEIIWGLGPMITETSVKIELFQDSQFVQVITPSTNNDGSHHWRVSSVNGSGENFTIKITSLSDSTETDISFPFRIVSDFLGSYSINQPLKDFKAKVNSALTINWSSIGSPGNVRISLYKDTVQVLIITSSTTNDGAHVWSSVSSSLDTGKDYRIKLESVGDPGIFIFSENFIISSQFEGSYSIIQPSIGFQAKLDSALTINWGSTGTPGNTRIYLYKDTVRVLTISSSTENDGTHIWSRVSSSLGTGADYRIKLESVGDPGVFAISENFGISSAFQGSFAITWPPTGDSLALGSVQNITWNSTGSPGTSVSLKLYMDSVLIANISTSTPNDGVHSWVVPTGTIGSDKYKVLITSIQDGGISAYSSNFIIAGLFPDGYEDDDTHAGANVLLFNQPQNHSMLQGDVDYVKVNVDSGTVYIISNTGSRIYKRIYEEGATSYIANYNYISPSIWTAPKTGTYYIGLSPYSSNYGDYTISMVPMDSLSNRITSPAVGDTVTTGTTFDINWNTDSSFFGTTVRLYLYKDAVQVATIISSTTNDGTHPYTIPATFESGNYQIRIQSSSNTQIFSQSKDFYVKGIDPDAYEVDDSLQVANDMPLDGTVQDRSMTYQDQDWMRLITQQGVTYLINTTGDTRVRTYVLSENGSSTLASNTGSTPLTTFDAPATDTFYIRVTNYSSSSIYFGDYKISALALDSTVKNRISVTLPDSNTVWASGSNYEIKWVPDSSILGNTVTLQLYKDTILISAIGSSVNDGSLNWTVVTGLLTGNDYRVRVINTQHSEVYGESAPFTISGVAVDTFEVDNDKASAVEIRTDGTIYNRSNSRSDQDWMTFTVQENKNYYASISGSISLSMVLYPESSTTAITSRSGTNPYIAFADIAAGEYYIRVSGSIYGAYQFSVKEYKPDSLLTFTNPVSSSTWSAGSNYSIQWAPDSGLFPTTVYLYLYKGNINVVSLGSANYLLGTDSWTIPTGMASGGDYKIRLQTSDGSLFATSQNFTIAGIPADVYEPNDSASMATSINADGLVQSHNITYRDKDWFKFTCVANTVYEFKSVQARTLRTTIALFSNQGTTSEGSSLQSSVDTVNSLIWFCPTAGEYHFSVSAISTGNYDLTVTSYDQSSYQFVFTSPTVGAVTTKGTNLAIQWTSAVDLGGTVDIFLYNSLGVVQTIRASTSNSGLYNWLIPTTVTSGTDYYIRIISRLSSEINGNSEIFTIN